MYLNKNKANTEYPIHSIVLFYNLRVNTLKAIMLKRLVIEIFWPIINSGMKIVMKTD